MSELRADRRLRGEPVTKVFGANFTTPLLNGLSVQPDRDAPLRWAARSWGRCLFGMKFKRFKRLHALHLNLNSLFPGCVCSGSPLQGILRLAFYKTGRKGTGPLPEN